METNTKEFRKIRKQPKNVKEAVERANSISRYICNKYSLEGVKTLDNRIVLYEVDCTKDIIRHEEIPESRYPYGERKYVKSFILEYTIRQYNPLTRTKEDIIWFELDNGYLVSKPIWCKDGFPLDINVTDIPYY